MSKIRSKGRTSRREFLEGTGKALVAATAVPAITSQALQAAPAKGDTSLAGAAPHTAIRVTVNGTARKIEGEDRWTLVDMLRDNLMLTGTKIRCDRGDARLHRPPGWQTGLLMQPAGGLGGRPVDPDGGRSGTGERLDPVQKAFIEHDAPQCGCTSGQLMSAKALLTRNPNATREEQAADRQYLPLLRV
jgi:aerobic-type carbon monoxide dehydrogenase small subunit (CoxS/CutS family)